jgi:hypothetical protein
MSFIAWMKSCFSQRGKALALYRTGIAKANKGDHSGAITAYSAAIQSPHIPSDVKAAVIYNRALAYSAIHEDAKAAADLVVVLGMPGAPTVIRTHAQQRQQRMRQLSERKSHSTENE